MTADVDTDKFAVFSSNSLDTAAISHATQEATDHTAPTVDRNQNSAEEWSVVSTTQLPSDSHDAMGQPLSLVEDSGIYWFWDSMWDGAAFE